MDHGGDQGKRAQTAAKRQRRVVPPALAHHIDRHLPGEEHPLLGAGGRDREEGAADAERERRHEAGKPHRRPELDRHHQQGRGEDLAEQQGRRGEVRLAGRTDGRLQRGRQFDGPGGDRQGQHAPDEHETEDAGQLGWVNAVSFLNLGACSLNLATLTTRFVFPQFSLEGKRVWILGMAPLGLVRAVKTKFTLAFGASLIITLGLILLSCWMLRLDFSRLSYFAVAITIMTFSLNGLAVGLGAIYPNFREENPSKIVSGFGGTFCLIVSFLYILFSVALLAYGSPWVASGSRSISATLTCMGSFLGLSFLVGWVPFYCGLKKVARFEQT